MMPDGLSGIKVPAGSHRSGPVRHDPIMSEKTGIS